jgi:hypothetical protein
MDANEFWAAQLKLLQAQRTWDAMVWKNMCACPWLFYPVPPIEGEKHGFPVDLL